MSNTIAQLSAERRRREEEKRQGERIKQVNEKIRKLFIQPKQLMTYLNTLDIKTLEVLCNPTVTKVNEIHPLRVTDLLLAWLRTICLNQFGGLQQVCTCYNIDDLKEQMQQLNPSQREYLHLRIIINQAVRHDLNREAFEDIFGEQSNLSEKIQISIWAQFVQQIISMRRHGGNVPHLELIKTEVLDRRSKRVEQTNQAIVRSWHAKRARILADSSMVEVESAQQNYGGDAEMLRQARRIQQGGRQEKSGQKRKIDEVGLKMTFLHTLS